MKTHTLNDARKVWNAINAVDETALTPITTERVTLNRFAELLRPALKQLGFSNRQISVRVPNYSMVQAIDVEIPNIDWGNIENHDFEDVYTERQIARNALYRIIYALFPANGSHYGEGGIYSDAYYYTFTVD